MKFKRMTAVITTAVVAASMVAGCGSSSSSGNSSASAADTGAASASAASGGSSASTDVPSTDSSVKTSANSDLKSYTLAIPFAESGLTTFEAFRYNCDKVEKLTNGTIINDSRALTPDDELSFVEAQCAAGVDGLILTPSSDSILSTVTQLCEDAGVYWGISLRTISDPEIKELVESSPYYVGDCYEDEVTAGYNCGKFMGEKGYKKIAIFSQTKGDTTTDAREEGLAKACEEYGMEIVGESRGNTQASDITSATQSFLAANSDLDCIYYVGTSVSGAQEAIIKAIQDAGRDEVKMVGVDFPDDMVADFESGILEYSYSQPSLSLDCFVTMMKVINAIQGTPINEDGTPTSNHMYMVGVDNLDDAKAYAEVSGNAQYEFFSDDDITNKLCKWNNPDLTEDSLQEIIDNYQITD